MYMLNPNTKKYTYEEFLEITKDDDRLSEFIDGEIYYQAAPTLRHQNICDNITFAFKNYFKGKFCRPFSAPHDIILHDGTQKNKVQPDVFVLCGNIDLDKNEFEGVPTLIVEVLSPSNSTYDFTKKLDLYERCGVNEYWIVKPKSRAVDVYSLAKSRYSEPLTYTKEDFVKSQVFEDLAVEIKAIFQ